MNQPNRIVTFITTADLASIPVFINKYNRQSPVFKMYLTQD